MADRANPFRNIRFIPRPGPRKLKIVFIALNLSEKDQKWGTLEEYRAEH